jgi:hypothetical protein
LEGSYAFHKKPPRRSKIWEKNLLWILWAASSSYELAALPPPSPHVATPAKVSTAPIEKIMGNIEFIFVLLFLLFYYYKTTKLIVKKR